MISSNDIEKLIRPALKKVVPYQPVEPTDILGEKYHIRLEDIVKIDANENPYGCSPKVRRALAKYPYISLYPDPEQRDLRHALSKYTGFEIENLIAGSGSDELIELILRLFLEPGDKVINCPPTFSMYNFCTQICAGESVQVPRKSNFTLDIHAIKQSIDPNVKVIFIASPNNPSGNLISREQILELLDLPIIVVLDEAYFEFGQFTCADLIRSYANLLVLRSFSKWAGLAGFRVGYGIFHKNIVNYILKIKQPYNVNVAAQVAAIESLKDIDYLKSTTDKVIKERSRLTQLLKTISWLRIYDSSANFVLCQVIGKDAGAIHQYLRNKGIFVRYYNTELLKNFLRISIGKPEQTNRLISTLSEVT